MKKHKNTGIDNIEFEVLAQEGIWQIVNAFHTPFKPFEVGQEVEVIETGEKGFVEKNKVFLTEPFYDVDMGENPFVRASHSSLRPVLPTYDDHDDATKEAMELLKSKGFHITKDNQ